MRIIGGAHKGRRLTVPKGRVARPSADRLRESLFNILSHGEGPSLAGARVADLFAGTGALGLEALSRGAAHALFVESAPASLIALRSNVEALGHGLGHGQRCDIIAGDVRRLPVASAPCDLVFLDPPYREGLIPPALSVLAARGWLRPDSLIIAEAAREEEINLPEGFIQHSCRTIGAAQLLFIRLAML